MVFKFNFIMLPLILVEHSNKYLNFPQSVIFFLELFSKLASNEALAVAESNCYCQLELPGSPTKIQANNQPDVCVE